MHIDFLLPVHILSSCTLLIIHRKKTIVNTKELLFDRKKAALCLTQPH